MQNYSHFTPIDEILFNRRIIQVSGVVNSALAERVTRQLLAMDKQDATKPVFLFIDSPGGEVNSGFGIFDMARFLQAPVYTVVAGLAASMGSLIALCAKKENRYAFPNAKFLIHQPLISGSIQGQASDLAIHARDIIKTREKINQLYATETGKPFDQIQKLTDRDHWMDPKEALDLGLISKIITTRNELPLG